MQELLSLEIKKLKKYSHWLDIGRSESVKKQIKAIPEASIGSV